MTRKQEQIEKMPFRVQLDRKNQKYTIIYQGHALNQYNGDKTVYSSEPFAIRLSNNQVIEANESLGIKRRNIDLVQVIVWRKANGGIYCDGTMQYNIPRELAIRLENENKIYWDITNQCYGVLDRKVYR